MMAPRSPAVTPWVGRLVFANAAVWVLLGALVTAPAASAALRFDPGSPGARPWALLTYPLVHDGVVHLVLVTLLLLAVGPAVERRMGARGFLLFYLYGTLGAAATGLGLTLLVPLPPLAGALGPALALLVARGWYAEDEEVSLAPTPFTAPIRVLVVGAGLLALVAGLIAREPGLSAAHAGGLLAGWLFFRLRALGQHTEPPVPLPVRRRALTPIRLPAEAPVAIEPSPRPISSPHAPADATAEDVNRVLDKISALGMEHLTDEERRILTRYAEQTRKKKS